VVFGIEIVVPSTLSLPITPPAYAAPPSSPNRQSSTIPKYLDPKSLLVRSLFFTKKDHHFFGEE
jgi:hypothetical protein